MYIRVFLKAPIFSTIRSSIETHLQVSSLVPIFTNTVENGLTETILYFEKSRIDPICITAHTQHLPKRC
jgi:hypothetical protein